MSKFYPEHFLSRNSAVIAVTLAPWVVAILTLLFAPQSHATELKLDDLYIEHKKAIGTNRTPLMPNNEIKRGELNLGLEYSFGMLYNKLKVTSYYASQFRHVSLGAEMGIKWDRLELFVDHYSGHALDAVYPQKYPNENSVGVRLRLGGNK